MPSFTERTGTAALLRTALLGSLPALASLGLLAVTGAVGPASLAALVAAGILAYRHLREIGRMAAWLEGIAEATSGGGTLPPAGPLGEALARPARALAGRLRAQADEIAAQRAALAAVIEALPDPVLIVDGDLQVVHANAAARRHFGTDRRSLPLARVLRDPGVLAAVNGALGSAATSLVTFSPALDRSARFSARIEPLDLGERRRGVLVTLRERTEEVMIERMRSDFVANASHEIRTPLAAIQGTIETLRGPARDDPQARAMFLDLMAGEAARMARLVEDLLSLSRIELAARQPPTERCDLKAVLEQVVERMYAVAVPARVRIETAIPASLPEVVGDADQLHQLLANLVDNAIKYGGEGKAVTVEAEPLGAAPPDAGAVAGRPCVRVAVHDQGPGIAREHIPRLTERFYRVDTARSRRLRGTGLGLAIVKHVLRRHQGHLVIESEVGRGSSFAVLLPTHGGAVTKLSP